MTSGRDDGGADTVPLSERLLTPLVRFGGAISTALLLAALGLTAYSVFMRYVIGRPPVWIDELSGFLLVALVMAGVAEAYRRGNHIAVDLLTARLRGRVRAAQTVWSDLCVLGFAIVLGVSTWESMAFARAFGAYTSGAIEIESWIPRVPVLTGSILLGALAVARLLGRLTARSR